LLAVLELSWLAVPLVLQRCVAALPLPVDDASRPLPLPPPDLKMLADEQSQSVEFNISDVDSFDVPNDQAMVVDVDGAGDSDGLDDDFEEESSSDHIDLDAADKIRLFFEAAVPFVKKAADEVPSTPPAHTDAKEKDDDARGDKGTGKGDDRALHALASPRQFKKRLSQLRSTSGFLRKTGVLHVAKQVSLTLVSWDGRLLKSSFF